MEHIKLGAFTKNTLKGVFDSLAHSERMLSRYDPTHADAEGRTIATNMIEEIRQAAYEIHKKYK